MKFKLPRFLETFAGGGGISLVLKPKKFYFVTKAGHQTRWHCISVKIPWQHHTPICNYVLPSVLFCLDFQLSRTFCALQFVFISSVDSTNPPTQEYKLRSPIFNAIYAFDPHSTTYWVIILDAVVWNAYTYWLAAHSELLLVSHQ
jgi:hypothetical protein